MLPRFQKYVPVIVSAAFWSLCAEDEKVYGKSDLLFFHVENVHLIDLVRSLISPVLWKSK